VPEMTRRLLGVHHDLIGSLVEPFEHQQSITHFRDVADPGTISETSSEITSPRRPLAVAGVSEGRAGRR
jgi:hypothetical protein